MEKNALYAACAASPNTLSLSISFPVVLSSGPTRNPLMIIRARPAALFMRRATEKGKGRAQCPSFAATQTAPVVSTAVTRQPTSQCEHDIAIPLSCLARSN